MVSSSGAHPDTPMADHAQDDGAVLDPSAGSVDQADALPPELVEALTNVVRAPDQEASWDGVEKVARKLQRPDEVWAAYRAGLVNCVDADAAEWLGARAVRFYEEWFQDREPLVEVLRGVLEARPEANWALERLSLAYTSAAQWTELLAMYDATVAKTADSRRRRALLGEASEIARDFMDDPDRALAYLEQCLMLDPDDTALAETVERLCLERGKYREAIGLWSSRLGKLSPSEVVDVRVRVARTWLESVDEPAAALAELELALADPGGPERDDVLELLERIGTRMGAADEVRRRALYLLREQLTVRRAWDRLERVLEELLSCTEGADRVPIHRALADRCAHTERLVAAIGHLSAVVMLAPNATEVREQLRSLAAQAPDGHELLIRALVAAGERTDNDDAAVDLFSEAARARMASGDRSGAAVLYLGAFARPGTRRETRLDVGRTLISLLDMNEFGAQRIDVLEELAQIATDADEIRQALGAVAHQAEAFGDVDRAIGAWQKRLEREAEDIEALTEYMALLERAQRWDLLVLALERRVTLRTKPKPKKSRGRKSIAPDTRLREDLVKIARVLADKLGDLDAAARSWMRVETAFGSDPEVDEALVGLLTSLKRHQDVVERLTRSAERESHLEARAGILERRGNVYRDKLDDPGDAAQSYVDALHANPRSMSSDAALKALLEAGLCPPALVNALVQAHRARGDEPGVLSLLELRLRAVAPNERSALLLEGAAIARMGSDRLRERELVCRAFVESSGDERVEAEVLRLVDDAEAFTAIAGAFEAAIQRCTMPEQRASLSLRLGKLYETRANDRAQALQWYEKALASRPDALEVALMIVDAAAALGRWDIAAQAVVSSMRAHREPQEPIFAHLEAAAERHGGWQSLGAALDTALASVSDLSSELVADTLARMARWHRDRLRDPDGAEALLLRAVENDPGDPEAWRELADLQRRYPGPPLIRSLVRLSELVDEPVEVLHEAAAIALEGADRGYARAVLERYFDAIRERWDRQHVAPPDEQVVRVAEHLASIFAASGEHAKSAELLLETLRLPISPEASLALRRRAAIIVLEHGYDRVSAVDLCREIVEASPGDVEITTRLSDLYEAAGEWDQQRVLWERAVAAAKDVQLRVHARLALARALRHTDRTEAAIEILRENLVDISGHDGSLSALTEVLSSVGRNDELAALLVQQARLLDHTAARERAGDLWAQAADVFETALHDPERALECHRQSVAIRPTARSLDALARVNTVLGEHGQAVKRLEQLIAMSAPFEKLDAVMRLARACAALGNHARAIDKLREASAAEPDRLDAKALLVELYRASQSWAPLFEALSEAAASELPADAKLAVLREAAQIAIERLEAPGRAVPLLTQALALNPEDAQTRITLAGALRLSGRVAEAKAQLLEMLDAFGRRRPPERATVHFELAQIARDERDVEGALTQLDMATGIDVSHAAALRMLGELSRDAGQLERAERAFRMLLLIARRYDPERDDGMSPTSVGPSEVLYELHLIAERLQQERRARETLESAFELARHSASESRRLERVLRRNGASALLARALKSRLGLTKGDHAAAVVILRELAAIHRDIDADANAALELLLKALSHAPLDEGLHEETRTLAAVAGRFERYVDTLDILAGQAAASNVNERAYALYLRLGEAYEMQVGDIERAARAYDHAREHTPLTLPLYAAANRVHTARGDQAALEELLHDVVHATPDGLSVTDRADAMYRLAEIEIHADSTRSAGIEVLLRALELDAQPHRAAHVLQTAAEAAPGDGRVTVALEKMARLIGDRPMLLDALERRLVLPDATVAQASEAADIAREIGASERIEPLLTAAVKIAQRTDATVARGAMIALAACRREAGDAPAARDWLRAAFEGRSTRAELLEIARLASLDALDLMLAAEAYEKVFATDPSDRAVWEPLLGVYRQLDDRERLERAIKRVEDSVFDNRERNVMRLERAKVLMSRQRWDEAISALRYVMGNDPRSAEAAGLLKDVFRESGRGGALAEFLRQQLVLASERSDVDTVVALSLELGAALGSQRRTEAMEVYRSALQFAPSHRALLEAQLALVLPTDPPGERADTLEKLLELEQDRGIVVQKAGELAALRESLSDPAGAIRALVRAVGADPHDDASRRRLEDLLASQNQYQQLAELIENQTLTLDDAEFAATRLRQAALIRREQLRDAAGAVTTLRMAREFGPAMPELVFDMVACLRALGDVAMAQREISAAIANDGFSRGLRGEMLVLRAELHAAQGNANAELADLSAAYAMNPAVFDDYVRALERVRDGASQTGDLAAEGKATLQLSELVADAGQPNRACELLSNWLSRSPGDAGAWRKLAGLHAAAARWGAAAEAWRELVSIEEGEKRVDAVLQYADACTKLGRPEDAKANLEAVARAVPRDTRVMARLRALYESAGAHRELAVMCEAAAESARDDGERYRNLVVAGELWLRSLNDPKRAIEVLQRAHALRPNECETAVLLADALTAQKRGDEADAVLKATANALKGKRSRELSVVQHRIAQSAAASGDRRGAFTWLSSALENDMQSGPVASDLAEVALALREFETALKALRAIALMKNPGPMSRAVSFQRQAVIAIEQDDKKRAVFYVKKALAEDPGLVEAATLLKTLSDE